MKRKRQAYVFFILLFLAITTVIVLSIKNNTNEKVYTNDNKKPLYNFSLTSSAKNYTASSNDKNKVNVTPNNKNASKNKSTSNSVH